MSFVRGQAFARRAMVMLPDNLYSANRESLPVSAAPYRTIQDLREAVDTHQPHLAFLFSGYLYSHEHGLISPESLDAFLGDLRKRGCPIITSDPFLGLAPRLTIAQVDRRIGTLGQAFWTRWVMRLALRFKNPNANAVRVPSLDGATHLYPTSIPHCGDAVRRVSFFNPTIARRAAVSQTSTSPTGHSELPDPQGRWVFVLSTTDLRIQTALLGRRAFERRLLATLGQAAAAGKLSTVIAPAAIVDRLAKARPDSTELLAFCPFAEFERRILDAEYAFYWNQFSFSQLARVAHELPFFVYDRGHLARTIKPYYQLARLCHFGGWVPTYLNQQQVIDPDILARLADAQKPAMRALRERWQLSPTPDQLVNQLLSHIMPDAE